MSRIGRLPVPIPSGVDVAIDGQAVTVKGPKGTLALTVAEPIAVAQEDSVIRVTRPSDEGKVRALHGLSRTLIANMVTGVTQGFSKTLEIVGVGYRVQAKGRDLEFSLGFSHPVLVTPPEGHHLPRRGADQVRGRGHRQAAGGRDRGTDPQAPQARPVQGQGRAVPGRSDPAQGREGW